MNKELSIEKQKLVYDVVEKLIQEYADRPLKEGEEIIAFEVKAFIKNKNRLSKTRLSMGAFDMIEAWFNYDSVKSQYAEDLAALNLKKEENKNDR